MAVYDLAHRRLCVRVVYDGPAGAGKTTNVRQLASAFSTQRWGELETPEELAGRTLWFDWLQIRAGVVCGFPLVCQIVSVPGQVALTPRRRRLLADADVVVLVVESAADAVAPAREALQLVADLREGALAPPCVLQANKQDHVDALDPDALAVALGAHADAVVGAIARDAVGVVDTFVTAVRHLSRDLEARLRAGSLRLRAAAMDDARVVLRRLEETPIAREDAAEMVLAEAAALLVGRPPTARAAGEASRRPRATGTAPLPRADVPTGFIWPAHTGRATLERLAASGAAAQVATLDDEGNARVETDGHVLTTSRAQHHPGADAARQALLAAARGQNQLERRLVGGTVLAVQADRDGSCWLWRIAPVVPSWTARWRTATGGAARDALLDALVDALVDGGLLAVRRGLALSTDLDAWGFQGGVVRYVGDVERCATDAAETAHFVVRVADAAAAVGVPRDRLVAAVARGIERALGGDPAAHTVMSAIGGGAA